MMKRTGLSRTNYGQLIPYTSSDIANHAQIYDSLKRVLNDVFAWLDQKAWSFCFLFILCSLTVFLYSSKTCYPMNIVT